MFFLYFRYIENDNITDIWKKLHRVESTRRTEIKSEQEDYMFVVQVFVFYIISLCSHFLLHMF